MSHTDVRLRFRDEMRSASASNPGASMSNGCWPLIGSRDVPGAAPAASVGRIGPHLTVLAQFRSVEIQARRSIP